MVLMVLRDNFILQQFSSNDDLLMIEDGGWV